MCVCVCVDAIPVHMAKEDIKCPFFVTFCLEINPKSSLNLKPTIWLGWLGWCTPGIQLPLSPNIGVTSTHGHAWLFSVETFLLVASLLL